MLLAAPSISSILDVEESHQILWHLTSSYCHEDLLQQLVDQLLMIRSHPPTLVPVNCGQVILNHAYNREWERFRNIQIQVEGFLHPVTLSTFCWGGRFDVNNFTLAKTCKSFPFTLSLLALSGKRGWDSSCPPLVVPHHHHHVPPELHPHAEESLWPMPK